MVNECQSGGAGGIPGMGKQGKAESLGGVTQCHGK